MWWILLLKYHVNMIKNKVWIIENNRKNSPFSSVEICKISDLNALCTTTAWKVSKYGVFSGPYFPGFWLNTGKYGPEKTLYFGHFSGSGPM